SYVYDARGARPALLTWSHVHRGHPERGRLDDPTRRVAHDHVADPQHREVGLGAQALEEAEALRVFGAERPHPLVYAGSALVGVGAREHGSEMRHGGDTVQQSGETALRARGVGRYGVIGDDRERTAQLGAQPVLQLIAVEQPRTRQVVQPGSTDRMDGSRVLAHLPDALRVSLGGGEVQAG